jgi:uncharacterized protein (DUF1778 family)
MTTSSGDDGPPPSLAEWLRARSDEELADLLRLRPDLTAPVPASMSVLATRAIQRASVIRATEDFDTAAFAVLDAIVGAVGQITRERPGARAAVDRERIVELLDRPADERPVIERAIARLRAYALVWGEQRLSVNPAAAAALPWSVTDLDPDLYRTDLDDETIATRVAELDDAQRAVMDRLARTSPIGRTRDAAPDAPADRPVPRLIAAGLLRRLDDQTVALPQAVGRVVRGEHVADPRSLIPPEAPTVDRTVADVDGAAAGEALELLRHCAAVINALSAVPAPALKAGGLGVRELRRISKQTGIDIDRLGLLVEVLAAAGLIAAGAPEPMPVAVDASQTFWVPTTQADGWLEASTAERWAELARAWLVTTRRAWVIGMRDMNDKPIAALSDEVRSMHAAQDRRAVLEVLAALPPGHAAATEDLMAMLAWRRPRWAARLRGGAVDHTLTEAAALGVVGRGALSTPGRALLADDNPETAMATTLPLPVDYVLVQADLTVVAPGPLTPTLQRAIERVADLESAGGAAVYRIGEASVRRALDTGRTAAELHELFARHSRTPVPQSLTYLIDDVARRHGRVRVGVASAFVRSDDPAQLAEVLAGPAAEALALRAIAPTVAVSPAPPAEVLERLREAGFAPAAEDSRGAIVALRRHDARLAARHPRPAPRLPQPPTLAQLHDLVRKLRANDRAAHTGGEETSGDGSHTGGAALVTLLQQAVQTGQEVTISYIDANGVRSRVIVQPLAVGGGRLEARDSSESAVRTYLLHRIAAVTLVD